MDLRDGCPNEGDCEKNLIFSLTRQGKLLKLITARLGQSEFWSCRKRDN